MWVCEVHLYCSGPRISVLEVDIEYNNSKEYFVTNHRVKTPIIYGAQTLLSTEYRNLLWKVSDEYSRYTHFIPN